jgi:hypothetical protein
MKTETQIKDTRQPALTRAVINQTGRENLEDIARHGADGGFAGFTYYSDTVAFTNKHIDEILERLKDDCDSMGYDSIIVMLAAFQCLKGYTQD